MEATDKAKVRLTVNTESPALPLLFLSSEVFLATARQKKYEAVSEDILR